MAGTPEQGQTSDEALKASRRKRSIALAIALGVVVVIFYALTVVKLGPAVFDRGL